MRVLYWLTDFDIFATSDNSNLCQFLNERAGARPRVKLSSASSTCNFRRFFSCLKTKLNEIRPFPRYGRCRMHCSRFIILQPHLFRRNKPSVLLRSTCFFSSPCTFCSPRFHPNLPAFSSSLCRVLHASETTYFDFRSGFLHDNIFRGFPLSFRFGSAISVQFTFSSVTPRSFCPWTRLSSRLYSVCPYKTIIHNKFGAYTPFVALRLVVF